MREAEVVADAKMQIIKMTTTMMMFDYDYDDGVVVVDDDDRFDDHVDVYVEEHGDYDVDVVRLLLDHYNFQHLFLLHSITSHKRLYLRQLPNHCQLGKASMAKRLH